jgi:hypothetical protein
LGVSLHPTAVRSAQQQVVNAGIVWTKAFNHGLPSRVATGRST